MRTLRVLIVEDEADLAEALQIRLGREGYRCLISGRVSDAIQKIRRETFGLILLDMKLEGGHGAPLVDVIRDPLIKLNLTTPIIVMSGHLEREIIKTLGSRIQGAFVKPFDTEQLVAKVTSLLPQKSLPF